MNITTLSIIGLSVGALVLANVEDAKHRAPRPKAHKVIMTASRVNMNVTRLNTNQVRHLMPNMEKPPVVKAVPKVNNTNVVCQPPTQPPSEWWTINTKIATLQEKARPIQIRLGALQDVCSARKPLYMDCEKEQQEIKEAKSRLIDINHEIAELKSRLRLIDAQEKLNRTAPIPSVAE